MSDLLNILIIEDSEDHVLLLEDEIGRDANLYVARNFKTAEELLVAHPVDIILTDYKLPDVDGLNVINKIRDNNTTIPIVVMTSYGNESLAVKMMKAGASDYIVKCNETFDRILSTLTKVYKDNVIKVENQKLQNDLEEKNLELLKRNQQYRDLISIVSHDLRSPVGSIHTACELLLDFDMSLAEETKDIIEMIRSQSLVSLNLMSDLLDIGKLESDNNKLDFEVFRFSEMFKLIKDSQFKNLKDKDVELVNHIDSELLVRADFGRIFQLFSNLISNAIKYGSNSTKVELFCESADDEHQELHFKVKDYGRGIPKDKLESVFNKFEQAKLSDSSMGTGLGLSICKMICESHEGRIWVESDGEDRGSEFNFILPIAFNISDHAVVPEKTSILLADDSEDIRYLTGGDLEEIGFKVDYAIDGQDTVDKVLSSNYDLLLVDISMPKKTGLEALREIRSIDHCKDTPAIIMTNTAAPTILDDIKELSNGFIYKPASAVELKERISLILGGEVELPKRYREELKNILVVDDEEDIRSIIVDELSDQGFNCFSAKNGYEAIFLYSKYKIDLIITDLRMPQMGGIDFVQALKKKFTSLPNIILLSGYSEDISDDILSSTQVHSFMHKPISFEKLRDNVFDALKFSSGEKKKRVLVIDDSYSEAELTKRVLRNEGVIVHWVDCLAKAMLFLHDNQYDVVLVDNNLPDMKGVEVVKILKSFEKESGLDTMNIVGFLDQDDIPSRKDFEVLGCKIVEKTADMKILKDSIYSIIKK